MKLKSIRAYGFKSFADCMDMEFKTNITAIVGPNGSGKSNIVDAVKWVLGEQSIKSLRGSSSMSDVIFTGSETRAPFKRAEVSLTFDNTEKFLNTDLLDVEVKRILYYTGENEYFINNTKVRLKDITSLFLDSGVGNDSFNIISQGNIESIVNSKPIDRRVILESAAHVLKYKTRKTESLRKLDKTKDNLEKIDFVLRELKETVEPLQEQCEIAKKYLGYKEELQDLEISLTTRDITFMHEDYDKLLAKIKELSAQKEVLESTSKVDTSHSEKLRLEQIQIEEKISSLNDLLIQCNNELAKLSGEKRLLQERQSYEVNEHKIDEHLLAFKEQELKLKKDQTLLENDYDALKKEYQKAVNEKSDMDSETRLFKVKYNHFKTDLEQKTRELLALQNQITILEQNIENNVLVPYAVKNILNNPRLKGIHKTIGKLLTVKEEFITAIDIALGASSNFLVVDDELCAQKAITYLKENNLGRATFFPLNIIKAKSIPSSLIDQVSIEPGFIGLASSLVTSDDIYQNIILNQLGNVLVVDSMAASEKIGKLVNYAYRIVTLEGELIHPGGSVTGGSIKKQNSELREKQELANQKKQLVDSQATTCLLEKKAEDYLTKEKEIQVKELDLDKKISLLREVLRQKEKSLQEKETEQEELLAKMTGADAIKKGSLEEDFLHFMELIQAKEVEKSQLEKELYGYKKKKSDLASSLALLEQIYRTQNSEFHQIDQDLKKNEIALSKYDTKMDYLLNLLSETYHLTYEKAKMDYILEIEPDLAREKVSFLRREMSSLGEVNTGSIAEFERMNGRYEFLLTQKEDLESASQELLDIIHDMDEIMKERLVEAFTKIQKEFSQVFQKMFQGGTGILKLTDPENILETGIEIIAEPPGKKLNNIQLLSGGEKTLTALSLLFAILNVYPVPFCILDEVEASLDEANVDTFGNYLQEQQEKSEFILITHKKRTMEYAGTLYGITMQEQGVSKIVSVKLES